MDGLFPNSALRLPASLPFREIDRRKNKAFVSDL
jgi:hypothetical protein